MSVDVAVTAADAVLTARVTVPRNAVGLVLVLPDGVRRSAPGAPERLRADLGEVLLRSGFAVMTDRPGEPGAAGAGMTGAGTAIERIPVLAGRLVAMTRWAGSSRYTRGLPIGYFATGTAAAVALCAAADLGGEVAAIVSSQGRPDLVRSSVPSVTAATLLIVGGADPVALDRNGGVEPLLRCPRGLEIVTGASGRLAEPGALDHVVALAVDWFRQYLVAPSEPATAPKA